MLNWIVQGLLQWLHGLFWQCGEYLMNSLMDVFSMDMTEDEMFSKAYDMAGTRIMEITRDPIPWYA